MRIGLNLLHAFPGIGGVWNYMARLLNALGEFDSTNTYIAFANKDSRKLVPPKPNFHSVPIRIDPRHRIRRIIYENLLLDLTARQFNIGCMHWFANVMAPFSCLPGLVTVHDLLVFHRPEIFSAKKRFYLKTMLKLTMKKAKVLLPISKYTKLDIQNIQKEKLNNVFVLPPIIDNQFKPVNEEQVSGFKAKYSLPDQYFLYVAHTYPHKNHVELLHAYHQLKTGGFHPWPLVLRGDEKEREAEVQQTIITLNLEKAVIRLPRIPLAELPALYSGAGAMVYPSLFEGAGMPVIEAMACGCPVAASNIPAVTETAGDTAFLFDPSSKGSICNAMKELQSNRDLRGNLSKKGIVAAKNHEGSKIIKKLLSAYEAALN